MNCVVLVKSYNEPPFCNREILRYAGCKKTDEEVLLLIEECLQELKGKLIYRLCYCELRVHIQGDICDFDLFTLQSKKLAKNLDGCDKVIIFAATLGVEIDRLIEKYGKLSPSKALIFQAIGAERIESLCDLFCADIKKEYNCDLKPRFSAGFGDLPLSVQQDIFALLTPERKIGLTLNDSLLMSPSKSVTAFIGLKK